MIKSQLWDRTLTISLSIGRESSFLPISYFTSDLKYNFESEWGSEFISNKHECQVRNSINNLTHMAQNFFSRLQGWLSAWGCIQLKHLIIKCCNRQVILQIKDAEGPPIFLATIFTTTHESTIFLRQLPEIRILTIAVEIGRIRFRIQISSTSTLTR